MFKQICGQPSGLQRASGNCRNDRNPRAGAGIDTGSPRQLKKVRSACLERMYSFWVTLHTPQGSERRCSNTRRHANTVEETWRQKLQVFHKRTFTRYVASAPRHRLAKRAHPDINVPTVYSEMVSNTITAGADYADGMRFVDHQESLVPLLYFDEARKIGEVAVHSIKPFHHDQNPFEIAALEIKDVVQCSPVIVSEGQATCTR